MTNRKTFFLLLVFFSIVVHAVAQRGEASGRENRGRDKIGAAHATYISQRLELTSDEAADFWPVYREYNEKRRKVREQMRQAKKSGADDEALLALELEIKQKELDLDKAYTARLQKIVGASKLIKLKQAETDFRKLILRQIQKRQRP